MMIPLASMFNSEKKKTRTILVGYTIALALIGVGGLIQAASTGEIGVLGAIYLVGIVAYQWVANAMFIR
jgi:hypothetical protein